MSITKTRYTHMGCKVVTRVYKSTIFGLVEEIIMSVEGEG